MHAATALNLMAIPKHTKREGVTTTQDTVIETASMIASSNETCQSTLNQHNEPEEEPMLNFMTN